ncbi:MAG: VanZ family protein [Acidiferrobacterales bacterium]
MADRTSTPTHKLRRLWLAIGWLLVAVVTYLSLIPAPPSTGITGGDKVAHVLAYVTLMSWFLQLYPPHRRPLLAISFILMGIGLECLQGLTAWRSFDYIDMAANIGGVALGWLLGKTRLSIALSVIEAHFTRA